MAYNDRQRRARNDFMRVRITDIDLSQKKYPLAVGQPPQGGNCKIDLSLGVNGSFTIPAVDEVWWIERRTGSRWALAYKETETKVRGKGIGDRVEEVAGNFYINANSVQIKQNGQPGLTTTVTLARLTSEGSNGSLTFRNGILVGKVDPT